MEKLYCPKCGKENLTEGACFCAFCGGELSKLDLGAEAIARELKDTYINYINWSAEYMANRSTGTIFAGLFTANSDYNNREEHKIFVSRCEELSAQLLSAKPQESVLVEVLDYVFFDVHANCGDEADWMLLACEKYFLPFLELLSADAIGALYARYKDFRKKKMNLPVQDELLKKMKKLSKNRA